MRRTASLLILGLLLPACAGSPGPPPIAPELGVDLNAMLRLSSGLYIRDVTEGWGDRAQAGDVVAVHYTGWIARDGTKFDSSRDRNEPLVAEIGPDSRLIAGWNEGIQGMRVGGRRMLVVPPDLGYGWRGAGDTIPPNATLVFDIELLRVR